MRLAHVERESHDHILEGALHCSNPNCLREFPIIDGIPLLIANIRQYINDQILSIYGRRDLSDYVESIIGDCCGPNSAFDQMRQHLSSYTWNHYGDLDPAEHGTDVTTGSAVQILREGCNMAGLGYGTSASGAKSPAIDLGCSVGRTTFELAKQTGGLTLGIDLHFAMLRVASEVLHTGRVAYPKRRVGVVYERRELPVKLAGSELVDFWAADAAALPFVAGTFSFGTALNLLDCVTSPREVLVSLGRVLQPGAKAVLACPYDWSPTATAVEGWLGGHSQRSELRGSPEAVLRLLLTPNGHANAVNTLRLASERAELPWHVRLHERSTMIYKVHLVVAEKPKTHP